MFKRYPWLWPALKGVLTLAILLAVGRQFYRDLQRPELWERPVHFGWLLLSAVLYLAGLGFSALFWRRLLALSGPSPSALAVARAYYVGHLGKYLPGKAWSLLLRAGLLSRQGVRMSTAVITSTYEVLTAMASGMMVALLLFAFFASDRQTSFEWSTLRDLYSQQVASEALLDRKVLVLLALLLLIPPLVAILPPVFNRLMFRLARPFRRQDSTPLPRVHFATMVEGLFIDAVNWLFLGASFWASLQALGLGSPFFEITRTGLLTAMLATAYVAGFWLFVPGGLGVREYLLLLFLLPMVTESLGDESEARARTALLVIVLRLVWTAAEFVIAGVLYVLPIAVSSQPSALSQSAEGTK